MNATYWGEPVELKRVAHSHTHMHAQRHVTEVIRPDELWDIRSIWIRPEKHFYGGGRQHQLISNDSTGSGRAWSHRLTDSSSSQRKLQDVSATEGTLRVFNTRESFRRHRSVKYILSDTTSVMFPTCPKCISYIVVFCNSDDRFHKKGNKLNLRQKGRTVSYMKVFFDQLKQTLTPN